MVPVQRHVSRASLGSASERDSLISRRGDSLVLYLIYFPVHLKYQRTLPLPDDPVLQRAPGTGGDERASLLAGSLTENGDAPERTMNGNASGRLSAGGNGTTAGQAVARGKEHVRIEQTAEWRLAVTLAWAVLAHLCVAYHHAASASPADRLRSLAPFPPQHDPHPPLRALHHGPPRVPSSRDHVHVPPLAPRRSPRHRAIRAAARAHVRRAHGRRAQYRHDGDPGARERCVLREPREARGRKVGRVGRVCGHGRDAGRIVGQWGGGEDGQ